VQRISFSSAGTLRSLGWTWSQDGLNVSGPWQAHLWRMNTRSRFILSVSSFRRSSLRQRFAIFGGIAPVQPAQPRRRSPVAQLDNVHSVLRLNYETLRGLISLASLSVAKPTLLETLDELLGLSPRGTKGRESTDGPHPLHHRWQHTLRDGWHGVHGTDRGQQYDHPQGHRRP